MFKASLEVQTSARGENDQNQRVDTAASATALDHSAFGRNMARTNTATTALHSAASGWACVSRASARATAATYSSETVETHPIATARCAVLQPAVRPFVT